MKIIVTTATLLSLMVCSFKAGNFTVVLSEPGIENAYPRLSKDRKQILYQSNRTGKWQLYILNRATGKSLPVTNDKFNNNFPDWSYDNEWIAFVSDRDGNEEVYRIKRDGTKLQRLTHDPGRDIHPYFSPDGKSLLFNSTRGNGSLDIYKMDLTAKSVKAVTNTPDYEETCARYSHDMKQIVYLKNNAVTDDVFLMQCATGKEMNLTRTPSSTDGWPMFDRDSRWVYFSSLETGRYALYKMKTDGTGKQMILNPAAGEEYARVYVAAGGELIFNRKSGKTISIVSIKGS